MTQYTIPEFSNFTVTTTNQTTQPTRSQTTRSKTPKTRISNNRRAVILQMTEVGLQELYFGRIKSALDSFKIIIGLLIGGRPSDML